MSHALPVGRTGPGRRRNRERRGGDTALYGQLIAAARQARRRAYAPYSSFKVGAALLTNSGVILSGANVENASSGLTICAERAALARAIAEGHRQFAAIAIVAAGANVTPCGACRQVLAEFGDLTVICAGPAPSRRVRGWRLSALLPHAFEL